MEELCARKILNRQTVLTKQLECETEHFKTLIEIRAPEVVTRNTLAIDDAT